MARQLHGRSQKIKPDTTFTVKQLAKRSNNQGKEWQADNLMDYSICYSMRFTPDQAYRIRQVLYYSPLIPGPKKARTTTRAWNEMPEEEFDLPNVLAKGRTIRLKDIQTRTFHDK